MYTSNKSPNRLNVYQKLTMTSIVSAILATSMSLTGCQTIKGKFKKNKVDTVESAEKPEHGYYKDAMTDISKQRYLRATKNLKDLRVFYPTGRYSQQALLDLMYVQFVQGTQEEAIASANQFISLYPSNPQIDYAYYVRGVANMSNMSGGLFKTNQSKRDPGYYSLAFTTFEELIHKYPNSVYAPDAAKRMTFIYNQFAKNELNVARWYLKREAYVAAANRAKWVFQYFPQSDSTPEAIATLAYSYDKLGMNTLANEYKTLLTINYPKLLSESGKVNMSKLSNKPNHSKFINKASFGILGQSKDTVAKPFTGRYTGQTKTQLIRNASKLALPQSN